MWPFLLLLAALPISILTYGLVTGRMPAKGATYDRKKQPRSFWFLAAAYAAAIAFFLYLAWVPSH